MHPPQKLKDYFDLSPVQLDYLLFCSHQFKFICVRNLKVASSTIVNNLYRLVSGSYPEDVQQIFDRDKSLFPSFVTDEEQHHLMKIIAGEEYFTFTFVRNPYSRVLSAYLFMIKDVSQRENRHFSMHNQFGLPEDYELSFREFLLRIRESSYKKMNAHWRPQWASLGLNKMMQYDFIGRFENLEDDLQKVLNHLNHDVASRWKLKSHKPHSTNANNRLKQYYGFEEQALVAEIFEDDFRYFGYGYELPI